MSKSNFGLLSSFPVEFERVTLIVFLVIWTPWSGGWGCVCVGVWVCVGVPSTCTHVNRCIHEKIHVQELQIAAPMEASMFIMFNMCVCVLCAHLHACTCVCAYMYVCMYV